MLIRHLPNLLSALRLVAAPFAAWLILTGRDTAALIVFSGAGMSDALDGYIARHWGFTSRFGAWLDPAADKLLMLLCYVALLGIGAAPLWLVALVIARDLAIAFGWFCAWLFALPVQLQPLLVGKASTLIQIAYVGFWLLLLAFDLEAPRLVIAAGGMVALFTLLSGAAYAHVFLRGVCAGRRIA